MNAAAFVLCLAFYAEAPPSVQGIVEGPDGKPVEDADVYLTHDRDDGKRQTRAKSSPSGEFKIAEPPDGPIADRSAVRYLIAAKPGVGIGAFHVTDSASRPVIIKLQASVPIRVLLVDPAQQPVAGAEIRMNLFGARGSPIVVTKSLAAPFFRQTTNARGEAVFELLPVNASARFVAHTDAFGIQVHPHSAYPPEVTIALGPVGTLHGRLMADDNKELADIPLVIQSYHRDDDGRHQRGGGIARVRTDAEGRFDVPALVEGEIRILGGHDNISRYSIEETRFALFAGQAKVVGVPAVPRIRTFGRIVEDGPEERPTVDIAVHLQVNTADRQRLMGRTLVTDANGDYEAFVPPGTLTITIPDVPAPYLGPFHDRQPVQVAVGDADVELGTIRLKRGTPLAGTVVDADDRPVPHARIKARWALREQRLTSSRTSTADANERGEFTFPALADSGKIFLYASDDTRGSIEPFIVDRAEPPQAVRLKIVSTGLISISGLVVDEEGHPVVGAPIRIIGHFPLPTGRFSSKDLIQFPGGRRFVTDAEGNFTTPKSLSRIATYEIQVSSPKHEQKTVSVPIPDPAATTVTISDIELAPKP